MNSLLSIEKTIAKGPILFDTDPKKFVYTPLRLEKMWIRHPEFKKKVAVRKKLISRGGLKLVYPFKS